MLAAPAQPHSVYARFYVDELFMGNTLEQYGGYYQGHKVPVDNAYCLGLRRFGVQPSQFGLDKFWRFKCTLNGADGHTYDAQVSVTHGPISTNVYWHFLTTTRLF